MARLLAARPTRLPSFAARPSALARSLDVAALALPLGRGGYDAVQGVFGTPLNAGGSLVTGRDGLALRCSGAANGGGFSLPLAGSILSAGGAPGYSLVALSASTGLGENSLGRIASFANGFNWYPFGSGAYTWVGVWNGGSNLSIDMPAGTLPHDGVPRCLGISYMPGTNTATPAFPRITVDGLVKTGTQVEWPSGSFSGLTGPLYVGNAGNNARCFQGDIYFVGVFGRALLPAELALVTRNPAALFEA